MILIIHSIWVLYGNKLSLILVEQDTACTSTSRVWGLGETMRQQTLFECHVAAMQSSLCGRQGFSNQSGGYEFLHTQEWNHYKSSSSVISIPLIGKIALYSRVPTPTQKTQTSRSQWPLLSPQSELSTELLYGFIYSCPWYSLFMCIHTHTRARARTHTHKSITGYQMK